MLENPFAFLLQYAIQTPLLLVWLVGIGLSFFHWRRYPRIALVTCIACAVFIADALVGTFLSLTLPSMLVGRGQTTAQISAVFGLVGALRSVIHAVLWSAILFAIFGGRRQLAASSEPS
jgi:hypothetical protein